MQTKPRANSVITWSEPDEHTLVCHVTGCPDIVFDTRKVHPDNIPRFARHGMRQRLQDAAAKSRDTKTGQPAPTSVRHAAIAKMAEHYLSGTAEWNLPRQAPTGPGLDGTVLAAVAEGVGRTVDEIRAMVAAGSARRGMKPADYLAQLATADRVKPILERMRAAQATVDANAELDAMLAGDDGDADPEEPTDEALV